MTKSLDEPWWYVYLSATVQRVIYEYENFKNLGHFQK